MRLREQARKDTDVAATWYATQGGVALELAFVAALEAAYEHIQRHPGIGCSRHAEYVIDLPTPMRFLRLKRFEHHLVYYIELPEHVEVILVWHASRGLAALLGETE